MGVLSLKETLVLFSVYLSGECRITRVRETLLNTTDHFSGAELRNDLPENPIYRGLQIAKKDTHCKITLMDWE